MHRSRLTCAVVLIVMLGFSISMTSCGGGAGGTNPDLVLLGFNVPNLSGIPLNQALIFTFSADINPQTITPDSLRVVGTEGPFFEETVVDGNLVALLPTTPNFADYSDAGLQPDIEYTVSLTEFPAVTTIESVTGKPLLQADSFTFRTLPAKSADIVSNIKCNGPDGILGTADDDTPASPSFFIETRRPIRHGVPWTLGGKSDDAGCLQNSSPGNELYRAPNDPLDPVAIQSGSGTGAKLLCLQNEGSPRVIENLSIPRHGTQAYGNASAAQPGFIDLPAIRIKINEPLDPLTVEPFFAGIPVNVQLWRVGLKNGDPTGPDAILTNKPIVVQSIEDTEIILVPAGPVPQGVYVVNITPAVKDLPGCPLRINDRPDPVPGGYDVYEAFGPFQNAVSPGYRIYFKTLEVPDTPLSIIEDFNNNLAEWGDNDSGPTTSSSPPQEPGLYTTTVTDVFDTVLNGDPLFALPGPDPRGTVARPMGARIYGGLGVPNGDPLGALIGQSTTAAWNASGTPVVDGAITNVDGYRFLNINTIFPNPNIANPNAGTLQAVHQPWSGSGADGVFDTQVIGSTSLDTDTGSINSDGIFEYQSFRIRSGDTVTISGTKPLLLLCRGNVIIEGDLILNGSAGAPGFDTDGTAPYVNVGAAPTGGAGGVGGPGGGAGGAGSDPTVAGTDDGTTGLPGRTMWETYLAQDGITVGGAGAIGQDEVVAGANDGSAGGGGGGFAVPGGDGSTNVPGLPTSGATGGPAFGDTEFGRDISLFTPDRGYCNNSNVGGGNGGGGGSIEDDANGTSGETGEGTIGNGDDGGAGGGGGGGGLFIFARGTVEVSGTITANGGPGGNTYDESDQLFDPGQDNDLGTVADNIFLGLDDSGGVPAASGDGGPGGGGAGGGIFIVGKTTITVSGTIQALGGAGGASGDANRMGGIGSEGRIAFATYSLVPGDVDTTGSTIDPSPATLLGFTTPVELASVGQSDWVDLFTNNTEFNPLVNGQPQPPTFKANFSLDPTPGNEGFLELPSGQGGGGQTLGTDFDARFEFQGADALNDGDGNPLDPLVNTPTEADGLTVWFDVANVTGINTKRFVRWRWRFFAKDMYGEDGNDPLNLPLPTVFELTIPFIKN